MKVIKIDKQPTVVEFIKQMNPNDKPLMRFHLQHVKSVRETVSRKMKTENPEYKYETNINAIDDGGYIEVVVTLKKKSRHEQIQNN